MTDGRQQDAAPGASQRHPVVRLPLTIDVAGWAYPVEGLGPGRRACLWVRGCTQRCPWCISPELWEPGTPTAITAVAGELAAPLSRGAGLTISGGEPFDQPREVRQFILAVRAIAGDVEVLVYTGYSLDNLLSNSPTSTTCSAAKRLIECVDIVIDGPYVASAGDELRWRGSDNQRVHLLTTRAQRHAAESQRPWSGPRPLRVQHVNDGEYRIAGIPRRGDVEQLRTALKKYDAVDRSDSELKEGPWLKP